LHALRRIARLGLIALTLAVPRSGLAQEDATSESELLREHIEQIHDSPETLVRGVPIASRRTLPSLYERRGFTLAWTENETSDALLRAIRDSAGDGLDPEDYMLSPLLAARAAAQAQGASLDARIDYDLLQTDALARLLYHLIFGKVDPRDFDARWNFTRTVHQQDAPGFLQELIDSGELFERIQAEKPPHRIYRDLVAALARQRELEARGGYPPVPPGPTLERGARDPRVAALRARLEAGGDLAGPAPGDPEEFDAALETAVVAFQQRHGLDPDGRVGRGTLEALNVPVAARIEQIRVNLERGRWLFHDLDPTFVIVNVAGFEVYYLRDGELIWTARAMVGQPYRKTPIFRSEITYLVLNPTWTVPSTIFSQDLLPAQRRDPSHLASKGLRVFDRSGRVVPSDSIDWQSVNPESFPYVLRQDSGPGNALGRVKFMLPNSYAIYLHDTPSQNLFEKSERAFSSGCIRVERPLELAELLLEGKPGWDRAAIDRAVAAGTLQSVTLPSPVPILVAYSTAWVDQAGTLQLRRDLYRRDAPVARGLAEQFRVRRGATSAGAQPAPPEDPGSGAGGLL
jgi:murein L,D-transpeptidase YcbB/YkuD